MYIVLYVNVGTRPARDCPPMLRDTWRLDTTFRREPCLQWQYVVDASSSSQRLQFLHNTKHPDVLNTQGT